MFGHEEGTQKSRGGQSWYQNISVCLDELRPDALANGEIDAPP